MFAGAAALLFLPGKSLANSRAGTAVLDYGDGMVLVSGNGVTSGRTGDDSAPGHLDFNHAFFSPASTRVGVNGYSVIRTPVASKKAFPIAAAAAAITSSPAPDGFSFSCWTTTGVTSGHSSNRSIG